MENLANNRQECQIFSRCCGWLVPKHTGNPGKQQEYADRLVYTGEIKD
jgi:anaerobic ribonucleoside-triphosphate reductase